MHALNGFRLADAALVAACSLLLAGCGSSPGTSSGPVRPFIDFFTASPDLVVGDGGVVSLSWSINGATSATIDPGVGTFSTPGSGTIFTQVSGNTDFTLTATNGAGTATQVAKVSVCDPAPGTLGGSCAFPDLGWCQDLSGLGSTDLIAASTGTWCVPQGGTWGSAPCPTANRVGTCQYPAAYSHFLGFTCSASVVHLDRFYSSDWSTDGARADCATNCSGCTFTPN
jgi:hypothetical protein